MLLSVMTPEEMAALDIRRKAVESQGMFTLEGLTMIVMPTPALLEASLTAAREFLADQRRRRERNRSVSIDALVASMR